MRWIARFLVFAAAIVIGAAAAWGVGLFSANFPIPGPAKPVSDNPAVPSSLSPSGVTISYAGLGSYPGGEPHLRFIVHNGLYRPLIYSGHSSYNPFPEIRISGKKMPGNWRSGNGFDPYYILPGGSTEFHVHPFEFTELPRENDQISVGFYLAPAFADEYGIYSSEPFSLPEKFRKLVRDRR